jgi:hypothetical protein
VTLFHSVRSANILTLPADLFPQHEVASTSGPSGASPNHDKLRIEAGFGTWIDRIARKADGILPSLTCFLA